MSKKLQLSIPKPCHENWDAMTPVEKGKFCGSCQKQVVDFSNMSDRQVAEFFKKPSTGSVCGRFMTDQLNRDIEIPKKRIPWLKYFFQFTLPAFLVSLKASAEKTQGKINVNKPASDTTKNPVYYEPTMGIIARPVYDEPKEKGIIGRVLDAETAKPLPEASVTMISTIGKENINIKEDGFFVLDIYRKITVKKIEVSCDGYEKKEMSLQEFMKISGENRPILMERQRILGNLRISPVCTKPAINNTPDTSINKNGNQNNENIMLRGQISVRLGGVYVRRSDEPLVIIDGKQVTGNKKLSDIDNIQSITILKNPESVALYGSAAINGAIVVQSKKTKKDSVLSGNHLNKLPLLITESFKVFPNPVSSGSNLNIEVKQAEEGYYTFELINQSGQLINQQEIWIDAEARLLNIDIPAVVAGSYYLILTNKKSGKKFSEKLLIQ